MDETFALQEMTDWRSSYVHHTQATMLSRPTAFYMFCNSLRGVSRRDVIYETRKTTRKSIDFLKNELTLIWTQEYMKYRLPPPKKNKTRNKICSQIMFFQRKYHLLCCHVRCDLLFIGPSWVQTFSKYLWGKQLLFYYRLRESNCHIYSKIQCWNRMFPANSIIKC